VQTIRVRTQQVQGKRSARQAVALDSDSNSLTAKDTVKVIDGPHAVGPPLP